MKSTVLARAVCLAAALAGPPALLHAQAATEAPPAQRPGVPPFGLRVTPATEAELSALRVSYAVTVAYSIALAYNCGLRLGDTIVAVNGQTFDSEEAFWRLLDAHDPGVQLELRRGGGKRVVPLDARAPECGG
jgi:S1-C subfamily serine protease